jgi:uncharacterized membrane protein required for colicin V production
MSPFEFALAGIFIGITLTGIAKGFIKGVVGLAALILGLLVAAAWYDEVAATLLAGLPRQVGKATAFGCIMAVFAIAGGIVGGIAAMVTKPLFATLPEFSVANRVLGAATGAVDGLIVCTVFVYLMLAFPGTSHMMRESRIGAALTDTAHEVTKALPRPMEDALVYAWNDLSSGWPDLTSGKVR